MTKREALAEHEHREPTHDEYLELAKNADIVAAHEYCHLNEQEMKKAWVVEYGSQVYAKAFLDGLESARQAEQEPVAKQDSDDMRLLREIFILCEATEELEPTNDFMRGRIFEAKGIRRGIGTWYQDTFCGRSYMGEPVLNAAPVRTKDLTDDEVGEIYGKFQNNLMLQLGDFARAVIAADREKNNRSS